MRRSALPVSMDILLELEMWSFCRIVRGRREEELRRELCLLELSAALRVVL